MRIKKIYFAIIIITTLFIGVGTGFIIIRFSIKVPNPHDSFNLEVQELMDRYEIPSLAAGILIKDNLIWAKGFGEQPDLDTVYMIGSITKTFTATAILQLKDNNLLNLNDDINDYLPFEVRNPNYPNTSISFRLLLTHRAGLPRNLFWSLEYYFNNQTIEWINENLNLGGNITIWDDRPSLEDFLNGSLTPNGSFYDPYNWQYQPGSQFSYSNAGYQILGYLVEQITNQTLVEYFQENIFEPLNMTSTGFYYQDFDGRNAIPYEWNNETNFELPLYDINLPGVGALRSTIGDMVRYMMAHMNQGEYNIPYLLKPRTLDLMHSQDITLYGSTDGFDLEGFGLGWFLYKNGLQGHGGATPGYSANIFLKESVKGDIGVVVMYNRGSALIYDGDLIYGFLPLVNHLLYERAQELFQ
jgi:CubicO group peptidase (beta-lactamase class C family)